VLPKGAIEQLLGFLSPDGPLYSRLSLLAPTTVEGVSKAILDGVSLGYNPRKIAREVTNAFGMGLTDSLRMTRTIQIWSYRESNRATYLANADVVQKWQWHTALDGRACMACVALHGTIHELSEPLRGHHNCRCAPIPVLVGQDNGVIEQTGEEWFRGLPEKQQRDLMGKGRFAAWREGKFAFGQIVGSHDDHVYGTMFTEQPLRNLVPSG
jgi:hypothetical protein